MSREADIILNLLNSDNTMTYNKLIAHAIGLNEAVAYASLIAKQAYYERNGLLDDEGYFYCTATDLEEVTCLKRRQQEKAIKILKENNLIFYKVKGVPAKRYFRINCDTEVITKVIKSGLSKSKDLKNNKNSENKNVQNVQTRMYKTCKQASTECTNKSVQNVQENNINKYITKYNNKISNSSISSKGKVEEKTSTVQTEHEEVFNLYLQEISRDRLGLSSLTIQCLNHLIREYGNEKVVEAIKMSVYQNKRSLRYIEGILKNKNKEGEKVAKYNRDTKQEIDWSKFD